jgi:hypothetical protein
VTRIGEVFFVYKFILQKNRYMYMYAIVMRFITLQHLLHLSKSIFMVKYNLSSQYNYRCIYDVF